MTSRRDDGLTPDVRGRAGGTDRAAASARRCLAVPLFAASPIQQEPDDPPAQTSGPKCLDGDRASPRSPPNLLVAATTHDRRDGAPQTARRGLAPGQIASSKATTTIPSPSVNSMPCAWQRSSPSHSIPRFGGAGRGWVWMALVGPGWPGGLSGCSAWPGGPSCPGSLRRAAFCLGPGRADLLDPAR